MVSAILALFRRRDPSGSTWAAELDAGRLLDDDDIPEATRVALAVRWRERGRHAHAAVASYAHTTIDLVSLAAPSSLVGGINGATQDKVREAELCFAVARAMDGDDETTSPRAARCVRFRSVTSLATDCARELTTPRVAKKLARRVVDPTLRSVLEEIDAIERRREASLLAVLRWCFAQGALLDEEPPARLPSPRDDVEAGGWERWGIAGTAIEAASAAASRSSLRTLGRRAKAVRAA